MKTKILNLLGLATRARKTVLGEEFVLREISNPNTLVFLASDAGNNITKKVNDKAKTYNKQVVTLFTSEELSKAIGKDNRKVVIVKDKGFNAKIKEYLQS